MFDNNPVTLHALTCFAYQAEETFGKSRGLKDILVLSLGTGVPVASDQSGRAGWGGARWLKPLIDLLMTSSSQSHRGRTIMPSCCIRGVRKAGQGNYLRLQLRGLEGEETEMNNGSQKNLDSLLHKIGSHMVQEGSDVQDGDWVAELRAFALKLQLAEDDEVFEYKMFRYRF